MSFSDKRVAELVNSKFIATWTNRDPGFVNTDFWSEKSIASHDYEAYPTKNICTFCRLGPTALMKNCRSRRPADGWRHRSLLNRTSYAANSMRARYGSMSTLLA